MKHLRSRYPGLDIEVDGGVGPVTIETAAEVCTHTHTHTHILPLPVPPCPSQAGANMIVSGSAVVSSPDPKSVIDNLRAITEKWITHNAQKT